MKRSYWLRLAIVGFASVVIGVALPGIAAAQGTSGANPPPGVPTTVLPKTGNPDADTMSNMGLPAVLVAAGAMTAFVIVRRRMRAETERREQE